APGVVEVEERLEVRELVSGADIGHRAVGQGDAVFCRETEHHLGLEGALDVEVELDLGEAADQPVAGRVDCGHGGLPYYLPLVGDVGTVANPMTDDAATEPTAVPTPPIPYDPSPAVGRELGLARAAVAAVVAMRDDGKPVAFIAGYRKERTGGLDEVQIRAIEDQRTYVVEREARRAAILASVAEQGKLTPELEAKLRAA